MNRLTTTNGTLLTWHVVTTEGTTDYGAASTGCRGDKYMIVRRPGGRFRLTMNGVRMDVDIDKNMSKKAAFALAEEMESSVAPRPQPEA